MMKASEGRQGWLWDTYRPAGAATHLSEVSDGCTLSFTGRRNDNTFFASYLSETGQVRANPVGGIRSG